MIFACHKGFALTRNEFYWGQISSYLNTSLPPEMQGNYFAVSVHFSLAVIWEATCEIHRSQKLVTVLLKKADQTAIPFMVKSWAVQILLSFSTDLELQGSITALFRPCHHQALPSPFPGVISWALQELHGCRDVRAVTPPAQHHAALCSAPHWDKGENWKMWKCQNCWVDVRTV